MVDFGSWNLHLRFLLGLEDAVDVTFLDKPLQCSVQAMLPYPLRNARHPRALLDKMSVEHPSNLLLQHSPRVRPVPRAFTQIVSGILSMSLQPPLLLLQALVD